MYTFVMETQFIREDQIVIPNEEVKVDSLDEITSFIEQRSALFQNSLMFMARNSLQGWEEIKTEDGVVVKVPGANNATSLFTGLEFCRIASFALFDGLQGLDPNKFKVEVVQVETDFNAERWQNPEHKYYNTDQHAIVKVTDLSTNESVFVDSTYGQVNHAFAGKTLVVKESDLGKYYKYSQEEKEVSYGTITDKREREIASLAYQKVKPAEFQKVVDSVSVRPNKPVELKKAA